LFYYYYYYYYYADAINIYGWRRRPKYQKRRIIKKKIKKAEINEQKNGMNDNKINSIEKNKIIIEK
jgi:hypothetical protein